MGKSATFKVNTKNKLGIWLVRSSRISMPAYIY